MPSLSSQPVSLEENTILAGVFGINRYLSPDYNDLVGAVSDADAFEQFLLKQKNIPSENVYTMRDQEASEIGMLSFFHWVESHASYRNGGVIIIFYFAGHGDSSTNGNVKMICPSDVGTLKEGDSEPVQGLSGDVLLKMLMGLPNPTPNSVVFLFDCCFSAGIFHSAVENQQPKKFLLDHGGSVPRNPSTYTFVAACGNDEHAREEQEKKHGMFTTALLKALSSKDFEALTYVSLIHKIQISGHGQLPHVGGNGRYLRLFSSHARREDGTPSLVLTKYNRRGESAILQAGSAEGITIGSVLSLHKTNLADTHSNAPIAQATVVAVNPFSANLKVMHTTCAHADVPSFFYSKVISFAGVKKLALYCRDTAWLKSIFHPKSEAATSVYVVDSLLVCDISLELIDGRVHFESHLSTNLSPGQHMCGSVDSLDIAALRNVVERFRHFYYHLERISPYPFDEAEVQLKLIEVKYNDQTLIPTPRGDNLLHEDTAKISVSEQRLYGVTILNNGPHKLYPYLFYFDPMDLTISSCYLPPLGAGEKGFTNKTDAPLPPFSELTIGHSHVGASPWEFFLSGQDIEVGYLKLFVSTRPASFDGILRETSPFLPAESFRGRRTAGTGPGNDRWMVKTVTLTLTY